jgi:hypothetical protein
MAGFSLQPEVPGTRNLRAGVEAEEPEPPSWECEQALIPSLVVDVPASATGHDIDRPSSIMNEHAL